MKNYICKHCETNNLTFGAKSVWDNDKQEFVYKLEESLFEGTKAFCSVCDAWVDFEIREE